MLNIKNVYRNIWTNIFIIYPYRLPIKIFVEIFRQIFKKFHIRYQSLNFSLKIFQSTFYCMIAYVKYQKYLSKYLDKKIHNLSLPTTD